MREYMLKSFFFWRWGQQNFKCKEIPTGSRPVLLVQSVQQGRLSCFLTINCRLEIENPDYIGIGHDLERSHERRRSSGAAAMPIRRSSS
jgi:hypothetical protein